MLESAFSNGLKLPEIVHERDLCAEETARVGVEAGVELDSGSLGPITIERIECRRIEAVAPEAELVT